MTALTLLEASGVVSGVGGGDGGEPKKKVKKIIIKKKKKVNAFLRMDCYYSDRDDITFGSARSGNFEFKGFAGMFLDGFKVTQYSVLGTQIVKHGTAEVFTLASDRMETY